MSFTQLLGQHFVHTALLAGGIVSVALFGRSRPVIQWTGASKCVPVCSPNEMLFQYQPGPRSS